MQTANGVAADVENRNTALHGMPWAWGETWPVLLLFLGFAVTSIMITYLSQVVAKTPGGSLLATILAVLAWLVLPLAGFAVAAWKGFPRWSYPYTGYLLGAGCIAAALLTSSVFGGLVVLLAATLLALTVPALRRALHSAWQDWTLLSLAIYGILPFLVPIAFDDSHPNDITGYLALAVLVATAGAWLYTRGQRAWEKLLALWLGGMLCLLMALLDVAYFNRGLGASSPPTGGWIINLMQNFTMLLLASGLIGVLQRSLRLLRSAG